MRYRVAGLALAGAVAALAGCGGTPGGGGATLDERVAREFAQCSTEVKAKEGTDLPPTAYQLAGQVDPPEGGRITLWVTHPPAGSTVRSRCWYLDTQAADGSFILGHHDGGVLFGTAGTWPAKKVRVQGPGLSTVADVVDGYFIVAAPPTQGGRTYTITLLDGAGKALAVARDITPPAVATPVPTH
jgi:hypothetical protein